MKWTEVEFTIEELDELCADMDTWAKDKNSLIFPQFLKSKGLSYKHFKYFCWAYPKVDTYFEVLKSTLCSRWMQMALDNKNLPGHQAKIIMRYLRLYDSHSIDMEHEAKQIATDIETRASIQTYLAQNYAGEDLEEPHKSEFQKNIDKRGSD